MEVLDWLKKRAEQLWYIRGVTAAFALLAIVPEITSLDKYQFLRGFHALIVGWNEVASAIGDLVGRLPFLPSLDHALVNTILFTSAMGAPSAVALITKGKEYVSWAQSKAESALNHAISRQRFQLPEWAQTLYLAALRQYFAEFNSFWSRLTLALLLLLVPAAFHWQATSGFPIVASFADRPHDAQFWVAMICLAALTLFYIAFLIIALISFKGLAKGAFIAVTFVLTLEGLYLLNVPLAADAIDAFADHVLGPDAPKPDA